LAKTQVPIHSEQKVEGNQLGRIRLEIKRHLENEMKEIDGVVRGFVG